MISVTKIKEKVKEKRDDLLLISIIFLICLFAFSVGWIMAKLQERQPIEFQYEDSATYRHYNGRKPQMGQRQGVAGKPLTPLVKNNYL
jgi:hypothetical protein